MAFDTSSPMIMAATANGARESFTRNLANTVMDIAGVEAIDVTALGGTDTVTVNDVRGTDLRRVDVDLAATIGGSTADGQADTVTVGATKGDDSIAVDAKGGAVDVGGLSPPAGAPVSSMRFGTRPSLS